MSDDYPVACTFIIESKIAAVREFPKHLKLDIVLGDGSTRDVMRVNLPSVILQQIMNLYKTEDKWWHPSYLLKYIAREAKL